MLARRRMIGRLHGAGRRGPRTFRKEHALFMTRDQVEEAFNRYGPVVYRRARSILHNDEEAKDIMQQVFIKILSDGPKPKGEVAPWLSRVTINMCLNRIRDSKRRQELRQMHIRPDEAAVSAAPEHRVLVRALLGEADERCARAAVCVYIDEMSHSETAKLLGVSKRTVGGLLARFQKFAEAFVERGGPAAQMAAAARGEPS